MHTTTHLEVDDQGNRKTVLAPAPAVVPRQIEEAHAPLWQRIVSGVVVLAVLIAFCAYVAGVQFPSWFSYGKEPTKEDKPGNDSTSLPTVALVDGVPYTIEVPEEVRAALGIRKGNNDLYAVAQKPAVMRALTMPGSTALNPSRLGRVRCLFAPCRVVEIGKYHGTSPETGMTFERELQPGDRVIEGQVLGVVYSDTVGSKKNDLLDALVQLQLDEKIYASALLHEASLPPVFIDTQKRAVEGDRNAINRAFETLKAWEVPQDELDALRTEAKKIAGDHDHWYKTPEGRWVKGEKTAPADPKKPKKDENPWGRVTLRAPFDGILVERNVHINEKLQDLTVNLFQVTDVNRLLVVANIPEDDLPILERLKQSDKGPIWWRVKTVGTASGGAKYKLTDKSLSALAFSDVPLKVREKLRALIYKEFTSRDEFRKAASTVLAADEWNRFRTLIEEFADTSMILGTVNNISWIVDPYQHTAPVEGYIDNPHAPGELPRLRAGQYVSAEIRPPAPKDVVEIPIGALVDDGKQSIVFVQPDPAKPQYTMRRVQVTHRFDRRVFVRSTPIREKDQLTKDEAEEGLLPKMPLQPGERVLQSGVGELKAALLNLESQGHKEK